MVMFSASACLPPLAMLLSETLSVPPLRSITIELTCDALHVPFMPAIEIMPAVWRKVTVSPAVVP